jgi:MFS family permease
MSTDEIPSSSRLLFDLKKLPAPFWVLFAGTFINRFGTFVFPFLALYLTRNGYTPSQAGVAIATFGAGSCAGNIFGGWLSDQIGRRNTIAVATFAAAIAMIAISQAHTFAAIVVTILAAGFTNAIYHPASSALVADVVPPELRLRAYAAIRLAINAGFAFGAAAGGFLAEYSFFWLFAGDAATTAAYGILALTLLPHGRRSARAVSGWAEAVRAIRNDRRAHALMVSTFAIALVFHQMSTTFALQGTAVGLSMKTIGALLSWNGVLIVSLELVLTSITRRFAPKRAMAVGYLLIGGGMALNAWSPSFFTLWLAMTVFTFGEMISIPVNSSYVAGLAPPEMRGRYMGVMGLSWSAASMLGPSLGMRLFAISPLALWIGCGALGIFAAAVLLRFTPQVATFAAPKATDAQEVRLPA